MEENQDDTKEQKVKGPNGIEFRPSNPIWTRAKTLARDKTARVDELAVCVSQDPVLILELLKISNALFFSPGSNPITSAKTAIVRLGSDAVIELFEKFNDREEFEDEDCNKWFEFYRAKAKRTSIVCRVLAQSLAPNLKEDCQTSGLFVAIGEMLAVAFLKEKFVDLANNKNPSTLPYHLTQRLSFDPEKIGLNYLRFNGIPENLIFPIDRDARPKQASMTIMRPLVMSARELVDAFDNDRWEKVAPGQKLSSKSNIRLLQMNDAQYMKIYERVAEYLFSEKLAEARQEIANEQEEISASELDDLNSAFDDAGLGEEILEENLDSEIENLINNFDALEDDTQGFSADLLVGLEDDLESLSEEDFKEEPLDLSPINNKSSLSEEEKPESIAPPTIFRSKRGRKMMQSVMNLLDEVENSEDLIAGILSHLVEGGPFKKTALIVVSGNKETAKVVAARGIEVESGQVLDLNDPLSPLANCFSKVQSFGNKPSQSSPFGSKAFAVSPVYADHGTPVALYADCGEGSISLEGRRLFRTVVEMLNKALPDYPGGIPND
jgi:HD-like signal output (HDOD) protein